MNGMKRKDFSKIPHIFYSAKNDFYDNFKYLNIKKLNMYILLKCSY